MFFCAFDDIGKEELHNLNEIFRSIDKDNDNTLSREELKEGIDKMHFVGDVDDLL